MKILTTKWTSDVEACMRYLEYLRYLEDMKTAPPIEELNDYLRDCQKEQDYISQMDAYFADQKRDY